MAVRCATELTRVACRRSTLSVRGFASLPSGLGSADMMAELGKRQAAEKGNEKASAYQDSRDSPKAKVGGEGYVPPLARGSVSSAGERASAGATDAEQSMRNWLAEGGDKNLKGQGLPLGERQEHQQAFADAGTNALNRACKDAGIKPASITAAEELRKAEERVVNALKYAIRKGLSSSMELEDAARIPRETCAAQYRVYNTAVLADKEVFGSQWPLHQRAQPTFEEDLARARE
mmetsp:Transcript_183136/g.580608  ORF Transcript_183136/g.580608 Transcript_183136/m.580608 type:complete len:234 (+) Transcript_183136:43-744(+)